MRHRLSDTDRILIDADRRVAAADRERAKECARISALTDDREIKDVLARLARTNVQRAARYEGMATDREYFHLYKEDR